MEVMVLIVREWCDITLTWHEFLHANATLLHTVVQIKLSVHQGVQQVIREVVLLHLEVHPPI